MNKDRDYEEWLDEIESDHDTEIPDEEIKEANEIYEQGGYGE